MESTERTVRGRRICQPIAQPPAPQRFRVALKYFRLSSLTCQPRKANVHESSQNESDRECLINLATETGYGEIKEKLRSQLLAELEQQQDPRVLGNGKIFDEYIYASEDTRSFYERYMKGEKIKAGWVNESDFEEGPLD